MTRTLLALLVAFGSLYATAQTNITILFSIQHATCGNETGSILA